jgi:TIR domain
MEASVEVKRIFVSHCPVDRDFSARLVKALREAGAEVWWDEPGRGNTEESERELSQRAIVVAVLTEAAFAS